MTFSARFPSAALAAALSMLLFAAGARPSPAADPFYLELLRDGTHAYDRGEHPAAVRTLRLACFGMLDEPKMLAACLARLALAQDKAADIAGFQETFVRLTEVEDRFQGYTQVDLPLEIRAALEQRLTVRIPAATLAGSPQAFRALSPRKPTTPPAAQGQSAPDKGSRQPSRNTQQPIAAPPAKAQPPAAVKESPAALPQPPNPLTDAEKGKLEAVRRQLGATGTAKELRQAFQWAQEVADAHPEEVAAQRLAGEAAYRVSSWSAAAAYLQRGEGLPDSEPELLFYLAVSLYESGDAAGAAAALRRSLPNLQRSPYVDAYTRKILTP